MKIISLESEHIIPSHLYVITMGCGTLIRLDDLENAGISYVPCTYEQPLLKFANLWDKEKQITLEEFGTKNAWVLPHMQGVQIFTGKPTRRKSHGNPTLYLIDTDIERRLIDRYPKHFEKILTLYRSACDRTPTEIETKSEGYRLSAFCEALGQKVFYKDKQAQGDDNKTTLLEFFSRCGMSRIDDRYKMKSGSLLDIPVIPKSTLLEIRVIAQEIGHENQTSFKASTAKYINLNNFDIHDLDYDDKGRSQYLPARFCPMTDHSDADRPTVRYYRYGELGRCYNCGDSWKTTQTRKNTETEQERIQRLLEQAPPPPKVQEKPSYPHFTPEQRIIAQKILKADANAGWNGATPIWTTKYEYLNKLIPNKFVMNGQPTEIEKRRVWNTIIGKCPECAGDTAYWIDRYLLITGGYCDRCHKDYHIGSYLQYELERTLPNSVISDYQGFMGDDPEFKDFRLFQPNTLTYLGGAMGTGKSTEIRKIAKILANDNLGRTIIAVPRISLARHLAFQYRDLDGYNAWGLWHEGVQRRDRFIGEIGAIVCLPSLPNAMKTVGDDELIHIAIDEIDFSYALTSLAIEQAVQVKECLHYGLKTTGLVVAGQTESTLGLEALIDELAPDNTQGFYNRGIKSESDGKVTLHRIPAQDGKHNALVFSALEAIRSTLIAGETPYVFSTSRRDANILAYFTQDYNPLVYNAYTKRNSAQDALLKNQRIPDDFGLFIGTSAADVGLSFYDERARSIIVASLNHGSRILNSVAQMGARVRNRNPIDNYLTNYDFSLPVAPVENENVALTYENIKQAFCPDIHISKGAAKKRAYSEALQSLADTQPETYIKYHLGTVANRDVVVKDVEFPSEAKINEIKIVRQQINDTEHTNKREHAIRLLENGNLKSLSEIRSIETMTTEARMGNELATKIAICIGWQGNSDEQLNDTDTNLAIKIINTGIDPDTLIKQRRGFSVVHYTDWTKLQLADEFTKRESTAISCDFVVGEILKTLLTKIAGQVWTTEALAEVATTSLQETNLLSRLQTGHAGVYEYKRARFLHCGDPDYVVNWTRQFISRWYPMQVAKSNDNYALVKSKEYDLRIDAFYTYLRAKGFEGERAQSSFKETVLKNNLRTQAEQMRYDGATYKEIAEATGKHLQTIKLWCKEVKTPLQRKRERAIKMANHGIDISTIAAELGEKRQLIWKWIS